jgi:oligoribonuclease (3'-5' exoribonuclease)
LHDVMIDIETTGTDPVHSAIIQIAAVRFDYASLQVGASFCVSLDMAEGRFWDEDTRSWWMNQGETYNNVVATAIDPAVAWKMFRDWCNDSAPALGGTEQRLWAKPISFEWPFLQSYARQFEMPLPFHYRNAVDLNSFTRGMQGNPGAQPIDRQFNIAFDGEKHNAIDDVLHQIKQALSARFLINASA